MVSRTLRHALAAPHSSVTVNILWAPGLERQALLEYVGPSSALVAAGVATAELMQPAGTRTRYDTEGRKVHIQRGPKKTVLRVYMTANDALAMPGVTPTRLARAISECVNLRERTQLTARRDAQSFALNVDTRRVSRANLRLVVDNTR
jgi:hypothetical protein